MEAVSPARAGATGCPLVEAAALLREDRTRLGALLREDRSEPAALPREDRSAAEPGGRSAPAAWRAAERPARAAAAAPAAASGGAGGAHTGGSSGPAALRGRAAAAAARLTVNGNKLQDPTGKTIILRGSALIDIGSLYWYGGQSAAGITARMDKVAAAGVQGHVVRLPVYPEGRLQHGRRCDLLALPVPGRHGPDR